MCNGCTVPEEKSLLVESTHQGCESRWRSLRGRHWYSWSRGCSVRWIWLSPGFHQLTVGAGAALTPTQPKTALASLWCNAQVGCIFDVRWKSIVRQTRGKRNNHVAQTWKLGRRAVECRSTAYFPQACCMKAKPWSFTSTLIVFPYHLPFFLFLLPLPVSSPPQREEVRSWSQEEHLPLAAGRWLPLLWTHGAWPGERHSKLPGMSLQRCIWTVPFFFFFF